MRKKINLQLLLFALIIGWNSNTLHAQISLSDYSTYSLKVLPFTTINGNTLDENNLQLDFIGLTRIEEDGDLYIEIEFIEGINSRYLLQTAIPNEGISYMIHYNMPIYKMSIIDNKGRLILQKLYGGERKESLFSDPENISSVEDLEEEWEIQRAEFYSLIEKDPDKIATQNMNDELVAAIKLRNQGIPAGLVEEDNLNGNGGPSQTTGKKKKPKINIYKRPEIEKKEEVVAPQFDPNDDQTYDLNGLVKVEACSKYSYKIQNIHPFATLSLYVAAKPEKEPTYYLLKAGDSKFFDKVPAKQAWYRVTYEEEDFKEDEMNLRDNSFSEEQESIHPQKVSSFLQTFFKTVKPSIIISPKYGLESDEVIDFEFEDDFWKRQLKAYIAQSTDADIQSISSAALLDFGEQSLKAKTLRQISKSVEMELEEEDSQKPLLPLIKKSPNYRNISPSFSLSYSQSLPVLGKEVNQYWEHPKKYRISASIRLIEWPFLKKKTGSVSSLNFKTSYESLVMDFNRTYEAHATDPQAAFEDPEKITETAQFAIQSTQLSAGLAWRFYFPLPILEIEGGTYFSQRSHLLWGEEATSITGNIFSSANKRVADVATLSKFRPYFGAKIAIPYYFSGYKFDCDSRLSNVQVFASLHVFSLDYNPNPAYKVFVKEGSTNNFNPVSLKSNSSKLSLHFMIGAAVEF